MQGSSAVWAHDSIATTAGLWHASQLFVTLGYIIIDSRVNTQLSAYKCHESESWSHKETIIRNHNTRLHLFALAQHSAWTVICKPTCEDSLRVFHDSRLLQWTVERVCNDVLTSIRREPRHVHMFTFWVSICFENPFDQSCAWNRLSKDLLNWTWCIPWVWQGSWFTSPCLLPTEPTAFAISSWAFSWAWTSG